MQREYWSYVAAQFSVEVFEVGRPLDIESNYKPTSISSYSDLPNKPLVICAHKNAKYIKGTISLKKFKHPDSAIYVFGSDKGNLYPEMFSEHSWESVYIPPSKIEMYSFQAGAIVMYDRWIKNG